MSGYWVIYSNQPLTTDLIYIDSEDQVCIAEVCRLFSPSSSESVKPWQEDQKAAKEGDFSRGPTLFTRAGPNV